MRELFKRGQKQLPAVDVDPLNDPLSECFRLDQIAILARKLLEPRFNLLKFVEAPRLIAPILLIWSRS